MPHFEIHNSAIFIYIRVIAILAIKTSSPMFENPAEKQFYADAYLILTPNVLFHRLEVNQSREISIWLFCSYILEICY